MIAEYFNCIYQLLFTYNIQLDVYARCCSSSEVDHDRMKGLFGLEGILLC